MGASPASAGVAAEMGSAFKQDQPNSAGFNCHASRFNAEKATARRPPRGVHARKPPARYNSHAAMPIAPQDRLPNCDLAALCHGSRRRFVATQAERPFPRQHHGPCHPLEARPQTWIGWIHGVVARNQELPVGIPLDDGSAHAGLLRPLLRSNCVRKTVIVLETTSYQRGRPQGDQARYRHRMAGTQASRPLDTTHTAR